MAVEKDGGCLNLFLLFTYNLGFFFSPNFFWLSRGFFFEVAPNSFLDPPLNNLFFSSAQACSGDFPFFPSFLFLCYETLFILVFEDALIDFHIWPYYKFAFRRCSIIVLSPAVFFLSCKLGENSYFLRVFSIGARYFTTDRLPALSSLWHGWVFGIRLLWTHWTFPPALRQLCLLHVFQLQASCLALLVAFFLALQPELPSSVRSQCVFAIGASRIFHLRR